MTKRHATPPGGAAATPPTRFKQVKTPVKMGGTYAYLGVATALRDPETGIEYFLVTPNAADLLAIAEMFRLPASAFDKAKAKSVVVASQATRSEKQPSTEEIVKRVWEGPRVATNCIIPGCSYPEGDCVGKCHHLTEQEAITPLSAIATNEIAAPQAPHPALRDERSGAKEEPATRPAAAASSPTSERGKNAQPSTQWKFWREARVMELEPYYCYWVSHLTSEGLHDKADIATVLAILHQQRDDMQDDALRLHREKMDLWEKLNFSPQSSIEPPESPEWLEAWRTFVKDYNRYVDGDAKMPFSLLRDSLAAFMGQMDLALASQPAEGP